MSVSKQWIMDRCHIDHAGCMIWSLAMNSCSQPVARDEGARRMVNVRREWMALHGRDIEGKCVTCKCENPRCLTHLEIITRKELQRRTGKRIKGAIHKRISAQLATRHRSTTKITIEQVREWRALGLTGSEIAATAGLSHGHGCKIARGDAWQELGNHWAGLGAR